MYGLPSNVDLSFFVGRELFSIHIAMHSVIFHFDESVSVTVMSRIGCAGSDAVEHEYVDFRKVAPKLMGFLNQTIETAEGREDGTLRLVFDTGEALTIYDDSADYESYTISHEEKTIVV